VFSKGGKGSGATISENLRKSFFLEKKNSLVKTTAEKRAENQCQKITRRVSVA